MSINQELAEIENGSMLMPCWEKKNIWHVHSAIIEVLGDDDGSQEYILSHDDIDNVIALLDAADIDENDPQYDGIEDFIDCLDAICDNGNDAVYSFVD